MCGDSLPIPVRLPGIIISNLYHFSNPRCLCSFSLVFQPPSPLFLRPSESCGRVRPFAPPLCPPGRRVKATSAFQPIHFQCAARRSHLDLGYMYVVPLLSIGFDHSPRVDRLGSTRLTLAMRLLHTHTLKLHSFTSPEQVKGGYAILSHVWEEHEQTYEDLQAIHTQCEASGEDPRERVSPKIRRFCEVAAQQGYQWGWADTCCIDRTSSAELSEAINSMFHYYSLSYVCFVYLADVPTADALTDCPTAFAVPQADVSTLSRA